MSCISTDLDAVDVMSLSAVSRSWHVIFSNAELWLNKLTVLMLQYPVLGDRLQGEGECAMAWYGRCHSAVAGGIALARRHKAGELAYLSLYGVVDGLVFTPAAPLHLPMEYGAIAELLRMKAMAVDRSKDHFVDTTEMFTNAPPTADVMFRVIEKQVSKAWQERAPNRLTTAARGAGTHVHTGPRWQHRLPRIRCCGGRAECAPGNSSSGIPSTPRRF